MLKFKDHNGSIRIAHDIRPCTEENFSPMITNSGLWSVFVKDCVQVLVDFMDEKMWINISKKSLIEDK